MQQLQHAIEVGLSDTVGADEDGEPSCRKADRPQRPITGSVDLADNEAHRRRACRTTWRAATDLRLWLERVPAGWNQIFAGGAPLQWRVFLCSFRARASRSLMSEPDARGPEDYDRATGVARPPPP